MLTVLASAITLYYSNCPKCKSKVILAALSGRKRSSLGEGISWEETSNCAFVDFLTFLQ